jgi:mevalonate kinase
VRLNRTIGRFETVPMLPDVEILLTNTRVPRRTKVLVKGVRELHDSLPSCVKPILDAVEAISQEFLRLIEPYVPYCLTI